ncbi:UPF0149 family protein [Thiohalocapsa marina]|nr:UPF0149 family protein [Thiohalocapsa marina]
MQTPDSNSDSLDAAVDYQELDQLLQLSPLAPGAAEAQGICFGLLATGATSGAVSAAVADTDSDRPNRAQGAAQRLVSELLPETAAEDGQASQIARARILLQDLTAMTCAQLDAPVLGLQLLLPAEDRPLRERAIAANGWTRGLLFGLALGGIDAGGLQGEAREAFDDLLEITRMDLDDLDDGPENEEALTEIVEFIRVAAMLVHEALAAPRRHAPTPKELH